jgi:uncharacterized UBP type Zn finger protein
MSCPHLWATREPAPLSNACDACVSLGDDWVHLRLCLTCGSVACCNESKNRHAIAHFHETGHPVMRSFQPGEQWRWCYVDSELDDPDDFELEGADLG